jgi:hypothetical protein
MEDYLYQVAQNHSDLVKVSVEGLTEEGRPIYLLKIGGREAGGDNEAGPLTSASTATIFIDAGRRLQLLLHLNPFFVIIRTTMQCTKRTLYFISFQSGIHAREWIAPMTAFYLIDSLVEANLRQSYTSKVL